MGYIYARPPLSPIGKLVHIVGMRPGDHPEFFRFPAPEGRSRESTIRLDAEGRFFHEEEPVLHPKLAAAMHSWIERHPDNRRYILTNGYDWTYFTVEDSPYFVQSVRRDGDGLFLSLSDGTEEAWNPEHTRAAENGALYTEVKRDAPRGPFEAKFTRHAQGSLQPFLEMEGDNPVLRVGNRVVPLGTAFRVP